MYTYSMSYITDNPFIVLLFVFIALVIPVSVFVLLISAIMRLTHRQKSLNQQTILTEYEPPTDMTPAEMGYLFDSRMTSSEVIATLLDLEQREYLTLNKNNISGTEIIKAVRQNYDNLSLHEVFILNNIQGKTDLSLFMLKNNRKFKTEVMKSLMSKGYIRKQEEFINYYARRVIIAYLLLIVPLFAWMATSGMNGVIAFIGLSIFLFPVFLGIALVVAYIYDKIVGQQGQWTNKLKKVWSSIEGYRIFVQKVELDRIHFESDKMRILTKNKALPYAVALGMNTKWKERLE